MTEAYLTLVEVAREQLAALCPSNGRALARAIRRIEAPVLKMAIWREGHWQFPLVNIATVKDSELADHVLKNVDRTYASEIVQAWNDGNRRYAVSMLNTIRQNNHTYEIRH